MVCLVNDSTWPCFDSTKEHPWKAHNQLFLPVCFCSQRIYLLGDEIVDQLSEMFIAYWICSSQSLIAFRLAFRNQNQRSNQPVDLMPVRFQSKRTETVKHFQETQSSLRRTNHHRQHHPPPASGQLQTDLYGVTNWLFSDVRFNLRDHFSGEFKMQKHHLVHFRLFRGARFCLFLKIMILFVKSSLVVFCWINRPSLCSFNLQFNNNWWISMRTW